MEDFLQNGTSYRIHDMNMEQWNKDLQTLIFLEVTVAIIGMAILIITLCLGKCAHSGNYYSYTWLRNVD